MRVMLPVWGAVHPQVRPRARPWCLAACAAVFLHAVLWWGWQVARQGALPGPATHREGLQSVQDGAVQLRLMASPAAQTYARHDAAAPADAVSDALLQSLPPTEAGQASASAAGQQGGATRYLPAEDLSDSPRPDAGWLLDEEALASARQVRLTMRVWVSAEGRIDRVALLSAEPAGDWVKRAVQRLPETRMLPGLKDGRPVPSTVVVEISSEIERFR